MKKVIVLLWALLIPGLGLATSGEAYLERFMAYLNWSQNLPENDPPQEFLTFIEGDTPLSRKLRDRWLYRLAQQKDWVSYLKYYKPSQDVSLQCFAVLADYYQGNTEKALNLAKPLWLSGSSQPPVCNQLFNLLLSSNNFDERLISQRIHLALEKRNIGLVRYLLKQYKHPKLSDEKLITSIHQSPAKIKQLTPGALHDYFYLYGLKRLVSINMDQAINQFNSPQTQKMLSFAQKQSFLGHVALYKAMRNQEDAYKWFAKVKPAYYNDVLLDWQIRLALKRQQWNHVEKLINQSQAKDSPCWQYWLARAYEEQGQRQKAKEIYTSLSQTRHYYGFLASQRIHQKPNFQNEKVISDLRYLKPYQPFMENIKALYYSKQTLEASRLLNDFVSELPKEDKSALAYWLSSDLQWHGKSVFLSNTEDLNNQLSLRFPLVYNSTISTNSKNYQIPQELIYAIIRQESSFREDVVSLAGARGLMQVMPATAYMVAKTAKIPYADKAQLFLSQKNINIGVAYLGTLAKRYRKHPVLMAAAYNAGPRQVNYWLKNHPPKQMDIWIETLPWQETRNYLKNVISYYVVYQFRMKKNADFKEFMKPL